MEIDLAAIRGTESAAERAKKAIAAYEQLVSMSTEATRIRREAIEELMHGGVSQTEIGRILNISRSRVGQLASQGPPAGRLLFGLDKITVAIGGKYEADKQKPGQVLAQEDFRTFMKLKDFLGTLKLDAEPELIPPPGLVRLNRDNLVVICGPRLSPVLAQILESDPFLGFQKDADGWYLEDKKTGKTFRSPDGDGSTADIAYFGQLPRPDGKGNFLYLAGIHASGPGGVIHYLETHLAEVYSDAKRGKFSMLISCEFDKDTGEVLSSKRETSTYVH